MGDGFGEHRSLHEQLFLLPCPIPASALDCGSLHASLPLGKPLSAIRGTLLSQLALSDYFSRNAPHSLRQSPGRGHASSPRSGPTHISRSDPQRGPAKTAWAGESGNYFAGCWLVETNIMRSWCKVFWRACCSSSSKFPWVLSSKTSIRSIK